jgi:hypothetical protein
MNEPMSACRHTGALGADGPAARRRKKAPAQKDEMPADGTLAARSPGEEFGTSRFQGQLRVTIPHVPMIAEVGKPLLAGSEQGE